MNFLSKNKLVFGAALITTSFITPVIFLSENQVEVEKGYDEFISIENIISKKMSGIIDGVSDSDTVSNILMEISNEILVNEEENIIKNSYNIVQENEISYSEIFANSLRALDFSVVEEQDMMIPENVSLVDVVSGFIDIVKEHADNQYFEMLEDEESLVYENSKDIYDQKFNLLDVDWDAEIVDDEVEEETLPSELYEIEVGDVLHHWNPGEKYDKIWHHTSMVTHKEVENDEVFWTVTEARLSGVKEWIFNEVDFMNHLEREDVDVLQLRKFGFTGSWWNPFNWGWLYPSSSQINEMVAKIGENVGDNYFLSPIPWYHGLGWYCSQLVWNATDVDGFSTPYKFGVIPLPVKFVEYFVLPIYIRYSPKTALVSRWR